MRARAMAVLAVAVLISAASSVFAADSMKHEMQRDLHVRMGMADNEVKDVQPAQSTMIVSNMKHEMQRDLHVNLGMAVNDPEESATKFESPTDPDVYKP